MTSGPINECPARIGDAQVQIGRFTNVVVSAQVLSCGDVAALASLKHVVGIAAEDLRGALEEDPFGRGNNSAERQSGVVDSVFATHQVLRDSSGPSTRA